MYIYIYNKGYGFVMKKETLFFHCVKPSQYMETKVIFWFIKPIANYDRGDFFSFCVEIKSILGCKGDVLVH